MPAAVVRPVMLRLRTKMMPAPRKPMPATTLDATRETSALKNSARVETSKKPYLETSIIRAAPMQTMRWVRIPASLRRLVRSMPMAKPQTEASSSRTTQTIWNSNEDICCTVFIMAETCCPAPAPGTQKKEQTYSLRG